MGRRKLTKGDVVQISKHGLQVGRRGIVNAWILWSSWSSACRHEKDRYFVDTVKKVEDQHWVKLGNLVQKGLFKFLKKKKGPLTGYYVKRDWVKFAK